MKALIITSWSRALLVSVVLFGLSCKAEIAQPATQTTPQNIQAIVDMNDVLTENLPSQFASLSMHDFFQSISIPESEKSTEDSRAKAFQKSSVEFIRKVYNRPSYAQQLSQDATHIVQFATLSDELNLDINTNYVFLRLFYNKFKEVELVDDTVVLQLLSTLPGRIERHFSPTKAAHATTDLSFLKHHIENVIVNRFTNHVTEFKTQPDIFVGNLSEEIATYCKQQIETVQQQSSVSEVRERLRSITIRLFELILGKLVWNPNDADAIWKSFNNIANGLQLLGNYGIVNHMDDLDDLLWSLTHRFRFFLELAGDGLPVKFYHGVEHDLGNKAVFFLEFKEQDDQITSKKEFLLDALLQAKARSIAFEKKGILTTELL